MALVGLPLTELEIMILVEVGNGRTTAGIAKHVHMSEDTVKTRLLRINQKLGTSTRAQALAVAIATRQLAPRRITIPDPNR
jgi:DNA-binding NarL/FixJ family response regulator